MTFVLSNFSSTSKGFGTDNFPNNKPDGTYTGPAESDCVFFASGAPRTGCSFISGNAQGFHFVHFRLNLAGFLELQASNKFNVSNACFGFVARVPRVFTLQDLVDGVQLDASDFTIWSPSSYPTSFDTSFDLFMQLNPLP